MQQKQDIIDCYNKTARKYADKFKNELEWKHFDRFVLKEFCNKNRSKGQIIDLGCGPGHTTNFLFEQGATNIVGTDLSPEMVKIAKLSFPGINFEVADLLELPYPDDSFHAAIAFYAIVHFDYDKVKIAFEQVHRVLKSESEFLFSFHIGNETVTLDSFLDEQVNIKFQFFDVEKIKTLVNETGFKIIDVIKRDPYTSEYPTERAYIWIKK